MGPVHQARLRRMLRSMRACPISCSTSTLLPVRGWHHTHKAAAAHSSGRRPSCMHSCNRSALLLCYAVTTPTSTPAAPLAVSHVNPNNPWLALLSPSQLVEIHSSFKKFGALRSKGASAQCSCCLPACLSASCLPLLACRCVRPPDGRRQPSGCSAQPPISEQCAACTA